MSKPSMDQTASIALNTNWPAPRLHLFNTIWLASHPASLLLYVSLIHQKYLHCVSDSNILWTQVVNVAEHVPCTYMQCAKQFGTINACNSDSTCICRMVYMCTVCEYYWSSNLIYMYMQLATKSCIFDISSHGSGLQWNHNRHDSRAPQQPQLPFTMQQCSVWPHLFSLRYLDCSYEANVNNSLCKYLSPNLVCCVSPTTSSALLSPLCLSITTTAVCSWACSTCEIFGLHCDVAFQSSG